MRSASDSRLATSVERGLQIAAEALFDTGSHILSGHFRQVVDRYADIPVRLAAHAVISPTTAERLKSLATFRNIPVHHYTTLDLAQVAAGLDRLSDFEAFIGAVGRWAVALPG